MRYGLYSGSTRGYAPWVLSCVVLVSLAVWSAEAAGEGFVPAELGEGDTVLGWTVDEVRSYTEANATYCLVVFSGKATLTGEYEIVPPAINMAAQPCFRPDDASGVLLPRARMDIRRAWFCFQNADEALEVLGAQNKTARVVIDSYLYLFVPYDDFNEAHLLEAP